MKIVQDCCYVLKLNNLVCVQASDFVTKIYVILAQQMAEEERKAENEKKQKAEKIEVIDPQQSRNLSKRRLLFSPKNVAAYSVHAVLCQQEKYFEEFKIMNNCEI